MDERKGFIIIILLTLFSREAQARPAFETPPTVVALNAFEAAVEWTTNERCRAVVRYGKTKGLKHSFALPAYSKTYQVPIGELEGNSLYYFQVIAINPKGEKIHSDNTFLTPHLEGKERLYLSRPKTVKRTSSTVELSWKTSEDSSAYILAEGPLQKHRFDVQVPKKEHSFELTGLSPHTPYQVTVVAMDAFSQTAKQEILATTLSGGRKVFQFEEGPALIFVDPLSASLEWRTSIKTAAVLRYGTSPRKLYFTIKRNPSFLHRVELRELKPYHVYYYQIVSTDEQNQSYRSETYSFQTPLYW